MTQKSFMHILQSLLYFTGSPAPLSANAFLFTDSSIMLQRQYDIVGRSMVVYRANTPTEILACAPILTAETRNTFQFDEDIITMQQDSPYENTTVYLSGDYPTGNPRAAILRDAFMVNGVCSNPSEPYNPFNATGSLSQGAL